MLTHALTSRFSWSSCYFRRFPSPSPLPVPYLPDLYTSLFIHFFVYIFLAWLFLGSAPTSSKHHCVVPSFSWKILLSLQRCPTDFRPFHFRKICSGLFMVPCWLSFACFALPVGVWALLLNFTVASCTRVIWTASYCHLVLVVSFLFSCFSFYRIFLTLIRRFSLVLCSVSFPAHPVFPLRPPPTVAPIPIQIPFIPHCLSRLQHPPWPGLCPAIQRSLGLRQYDKWTALRATPADSSNKHTHTLANSTHANERICGILW